MIWRSLAEEALAKAPIAGAVAVPETAAALKLAEAVFVYFCSVILVLLITTGGRGGYVPIALAVVGVARAIAALAAHLERGLVWSIGRLHVRAGLGDVGRFGIGIGFGVCSRRGHEPLATEADDDEGDGEDG